MRSMSCGRARASRASRSTAATSALLPPPWWASSIGAVATEVTWAAWRGCGCFDVGLRLDVAGARRHARADSDHAAEPTDVESSRADGSLGMTKRSVMMSHTGWSHPQRIWKRLSLLIAKFTKYMAAWKNTNIEEVAQPAGRSRCSVSLKGT